VLVAAVGVGDGDGLQLSRDSGATWTAAGLPAIGRVNALVASGPAVYAATDHGLYRTPDAGVTWEQYGRGIPIGPTYDVAVDPEDPKRVYVGSGLLASLSDSTRLDSTSDRIYLSRDGGESYEPLPASGFTGRRPRRLAIGPGGKLYLASGYDGLFARVP